MWADADGESGEPVSRRDKRPADSTDHSLIVLILLSYRLILALRISCLFGKCIGMDWNETIPLLSAGR